MLSQAFIYWPMAAQNIGVPPLLRTQVRQELVELRNSCAVLTTVSNFLDTRMSIGARLKAERVRLGLSQGSMGTIGGVEINAQGRYENGTRFPRADYLAKVAVAGVDVLFVITGKRTQNGSADSAKAAEALDSASECLEKARELIH